ncbi:MAG: hypothetical protein K6L76_02685 [Agarilytica sp.]
MKVKFRFQKRSSVAITTIACASSILMLVKRFGYPEDELIKTIWISLGFLVTIIFIAAALALLIRYFANKNSLDFDEMTDGVDGKEEVSKLETPDSDIADEDAAAGSSK